MSFFFRSVLLFCYCNDAKWSTDWLANHKHGISVVSHTVLLLFWCWWTSSILKEFQWSNSYTAGRQYDALYTRTHTHTHTPHPAPADNCAQRLMDMLAGRLEFYQHIPALLSSCQWCSGKDIHREAVLPSPAGDDTHHHTHTHAWSVNLQADTLENIWIWSSSQCGSPWPPHACKSQLW